MAPFVARAPATPCHIVATTELPLVTVAAQLSPSVTIKLARASSVVQTATPPRTEAR